MKDALTIASTLNVEALASELVKIPSFSHTPRQEERVANQIATYFESLGIEVNMQMVEEGRPNVIAKISGKSGPSMMFNGHIDTVPPYDMKNPFSGEIRDGRLYGRGAGDMKGPIAAMMCAMAAIKKSGIVPGGDIYFTATVDEEEKGKGIEALIRDWPKVDAVIVGEGTELDICLGHKGLEWIKVVVEGKKTHSGNAKEGMNAITMAGRLIAYLADEYGSILDARVHPILGHSILNIGTIQGGDQPSTVADRCEFAIDRRFLPEESREQVYGELNQAIAAMRNRYPGFEATVSDYFEADGLLPHLPFCINEDRPVVQAIKNAFQKQRQAMPIIRGLSAWTDAGIVFSQTDTDCVIFGPGSLGLAHTAEESIPIAELRKAVLLYTQTALEFTGSSK
jgi:succinyl-diaminopimelate desuccinylase